MKARLLIAFGTRPEAIKMAPLAIRLLASANFETKVCVTGQHREMLDSVLKLFRLTPDFDLNVMTSEQRLCDIVSKIITGMEEVYEQFMPDLVLVHGDTTTSVAASLSAYYRRIPLGHVEAGLRTGNMYSPWPEEGNRRIVDTLASLHFAPTRQSADNLIAENFPATGIHVTGNTVIDALFDVAAMLDQDTQASARLAKAFSHLDGYRGLVLITGHRRESFGDGFRRICQAIRASALEHPEISYLYPVHLNPNVRKPVAEILSGIDNVFLDEPLDYLSFVYLMRRATLILTDSGGIQEEAPSFGKPVLVMRDTTERPEAIEAGTVRLVGTDEAAIAGQLRLLLTGGEDYKRMSQAHNPYGDGKACARIIAVLEKHGNGQCVSTGFQ